MEFNESSSRRVYSFDMDGVLTNGEAFWLTEPTPNVKAILLVQTLYSEGNIIIVWTARQWSHAPEMVGWLIKHQVPFHGVIMGKGGSDYYIDDKAVGLDDMFIKIANEATTTV